MFQSVKKNEQKILKIKDQVKELTHKFPMTYFQLN